jgi:ferric-dicitrate binding protein FerR (iron transport regulator)
MSDPVNERDLRIGDADREQAAGDLAEHYAQGRLTTEEHRERLDQIWAARTRRELGPIFADLPGRSFQAASPSGPRPATRRPLWRRVPPPLLALFVVLSAIVVVTHLPFILIGIGAWFLFSRGSCGSRMHHRT